MMSVSQRPVFPGAFLGLLVMLGAGSAGAQSNASATEKGKQAPAAGDQEKPKKEPAIPMNRKLNEWGVLPPSTIGDGGIDLAPEDRVPEQYHFMRPDMQKGDGQISGFQAPPILEEFKLLTKDVQPGSEVRVMVRVTASNGQPKNPTAYFINEDYGRRGMIYVNFKRDPKDPNLFRGTGPISPWAAPGRYVIETLVLSDEGDNSKSYKAEFHPRLRDESGEAVHFDVPDSPNVDVNPPELTAVEVSTSEVRAGGGLIHFSASCKDDRSGPIEAETVWTSPSGYQSIRVTMVMTNGPSGNFRGAFNIPQWYEGGDWKLMKIALKDNAGNQGHNFAPTQVLMKGKTVRVLQDPARVDTTPPELLAVQFSRYEAKVGTPITVTALVTDEKSGVESISLLFMSDSGVDSIKVDLKNTHVDLNRPSKIPEPTIWTGTLNVKPLMELGSWKIARFGISDQARNYRTYFLGRDPILDGVYVKFYGDEKLPAPTTMEGGKK